MLELGNCDSESRNLMESHDTKGRDWSIPTFWALVSSENVGIDQSRRKVRKTSGLVIPAMQPKTY